MERADSKNKVKAILQIASNNVIEGLASEAQNRANKERSLDTQNSRRPLRRFNIEAVEEAQVQITKERPLDFKNFAPLRRASVAVTSIANDVCKVFGISKNDEEAEETKKFFEETTSDAAKFKALKEELRSKGFTSNIAIQQYLLTSKRTNTPKFDQRDKNCNISLYASGKVFYNHKAAITINKDKHGYKWNNPSQVPIRRSKNIKIAQSA